MKKSNNFGTKGWILIIYCMLIFMVSGVVLDVANIVLPALSSFKGWNYSTMLLMSIPSSILSAVLVALMGNWISKKGAKLITVIFLAALTVLWVIVGFAPTMIAFIISNCLLSMFAGSINICSAQTLLSNWFPRKKGVVLGWATAGMCLSGIVMVPVFNAMINNGKQQVFPPYVLMAVITLILLIFTIAWVKNNPEEAGCLPDNEPLPESYAAVGSDGPQIQGVYNMKKLLKTKQSWLIIFIFSFLFMGMITVLMMMVPRLVSVGFSQNTATLAFSLATIVGFPGSVVWGIVDQKAGTRKTTIIFSGIWLLMMIATVVSCIISNVFLSIVSVVLFACLYGGLGNLFPSAMIWIFGRYDFANANKFIGTLVTLLRTFGIVFVSVALEGAPSENLGYGVGYLIITVLTLIGFVLTFFLNRKNILSVDTSLTVNS